MKKYRAFTLIEMLIVLLIISVLILLFVPNLSKHKEEVNKKGDDAIVTIVETQIDLYELENGKKVDAETLASSDWITEKQLERYNQAKSKQKP